MNNALRLPKSFEEVTEATLLPEDWYQLRLVKPAQILPNGSLKEWMKENGKKGKADQLYEIAAEAEGWENENGQIAGINWVLDLKTVSHDTMVNGRAFRIYLPIPVAGDDKRVTPMGQTQEDAKMERIQKHLEAFQGEIDLAAQNAELAPGDSAMFYIVQRESNFGQNAGKMENTIDIGTDPQSVDMFENE